MYQKKIKIKNQKSKISKGAKNKIYLKKWNHENFRKTEKWVENFS